MSYLVSQCFLRPSRRLDLGVWISNCLEGMFSQIGYMVIIFTLLFIFGWGHMVETRTAQPPGKSMVNPFDMKDTQDFNVYFIFISLFHAVWNANSAGASAAKNPQEQRMAGILGELARLRLCVDADAANCQFARSFFSRMPHFALAIRLPAQRAMERHCR